MDRRLIAVVVAAAVSATAAAGLALRTTETVNGPKTFAALNDESTSAFRDDILDCWQGVESTGEGMTEGPTNCLSSVFERGALAGELLNLSAGLRQAIIEKPTLAAPCHNVAHAVGAKVYEWANKDIDMLIGSYRSSVCEGGFMHGILDAFGADTPTLDAFRAVGQRCLVNKDPGADPESFSNCVHGLGHAAWIHTLDPILAAEYCVVMPDAFSRTQCGEGILMDTYSPAGANIEHRDISKAPDELPDICANWPSQDIDGMTQGCANGAAFTLSRFVIDAAADATQDLPYPFPADTDWGPRTAALTEAVDGAIESCKRTTVADLCLDRLALIIVDTPDLFILDPIGRAAACAPFDETRRQKCTEFKRVNW